MRGVTQGDAQSIQYALADYFRYVAGHVAYEHQGEAIARQAAILDAVKRSMADAVECTARVAELERKLTEARLALDASEKRAAQLEQESTRMFALTNKQAHLLTQTGMTLRCYEQEPVTTSELHDLPGRAAALRSQLDCALHAIEKRQELAARLELDVRQGQAKRLEAEAAELRDLADRQADLLTRTAVAIRGPEPELTRWSHHDLPERAQQLSNQLEAKVAELATAKNASQGQGQQLEAEADALRGLRDDRAVYKAPDVSQGGESLMQQVFAKEMPSAAPSWGMCAVNGAPNGRYCPASYVFDIRLCTGREPCEHKRDGE